MRANADDSLSAVGREAWPPGNEAVGPRSNVHVETAIGTDAQDRDLGLLSFLGSASYRLR